MALLGVVGLSASVVSAQDAPRISSVPRSPAAAEDQAAPAEETAPTERAAPRDVRGDSEIIHERYPNRSVKVERHVLQDEEGNYVNHGQWTMWDEKGSMLGTGEFKGGTRHGQWVRWFLGTDGKMFNSPYYKNFQSPFVAEATFVDGKLHGTWTVYDSKKRKASAWEFQDDQLHGKAIWWFPTGQKRREVDYRHGQVDGELKEWDEAERLLVRDTYKDGRKLGRQVRNYAPEQKQDEGWFLYAREVTQWSYEFWQGSATITVVRKEGADQKHGAWTSWHKNGQLKIEGRYQFDLPVGKWSWWYSNGQKQAEGSYENGEPHGQWTWWHQNGMKQLQGEYNFGDQSGKWMAWNETGKVMEVSDFSNGTTSRPSTASKAGQVPGDTVISDESAAVPAPGEPNLQPVPSISAPNTSRRGSGSESDIDIP